MIRTAILLTTLLAASCSSGPQPIETTTSLGSDQTISMFEWGFGPSTVAVGAESSELVMRVRNDGSIRHEWAILAVPIEAEIDFSQDNVLVSVGVEPGAVSVLEFSAPAAGTYQIICPISGHFSQGMTGTLIVGP